MSCISSRDAIKPPCHFCGQKDTIIKDRYDGGGSKVKVGAGSGESESIQEIHVNASCESEGG